ncbi:MAG: adenylate/guanylate cyclase domain-containing protein [Candidatus Acidiferrum sp.]
MISYNFNLGSDLFKAYPVSNVASTTVYTYGNLIEGSVGSANVLYYPDQEKVRSLQDEIRRLEDSLKSAVSELQKEKVTAAGHKESEIKLKSTLSELEKKQQLAFLLDRVIPEAADVLLVSEQLRNEFLGSEARPLFAMSVDIRRSTDLMLKARTPQKFATFITKLCSDLMAVVRNNHGVVDKFTGDGILCFFPEFFSGKDAGYYALAAADACHSTFNRHYRAHRNSFTSVLKDVGLGIGVDYGECHLVQVAGNLTIVGSPVVYACRLGGAPAGYTLLNQPAYEIISERHGGCVLLEETSIEIKHEGVLVAYAATLSRSTTFAPSPPAWIDVKKSVDSMEKKRSAKKLDR